jgi:hypothetical protein
VIAAGADHRKDSVRLRIAVRPSPNRMTRSRKIKMSPSPPEVTASINDLVSANRALRSKLLDNERFLTHAVQLMDEGTSPGQVLVTVPSVQDAELWKTQSIAL